jgi:Domain of unknown function (DUF1874).
MTVYISNAFSLSMLTPPTTIKVVEASVEDVKNILNQGFVSAIGHEATAKIITTQLGVNVPVNRVSISLKRGDTLLVYQLLKRLEEGKVLTEQEMMQVPAKWYIVTLQ